MHAPAVLDRNGLRYTYAMKFMKHMRNTIQINHIMHYFWNCKANTHTRGRDQTNSNQIFCLCDLALDSFLILQLPACSPYVFYFVPHKQFTVALLQFFLHGYAPDVRLAMRIRISHSNCFGFRHCLRMLITFFTSYHIKNCGSSVMAFYCMGMRRTFGWPYA